MLLKQDSPGLSEQTIMAQQVDLSQGDSSAKNTGSGLGTENDTKSPVAQKETTSKEKDTSPSGFQAAESHGSQSTERQTSLKTSKKFVDEDSRSPEYRSDDWRMKHFKVSPWFCVPDS